MSHKVVLFVTGTRADFGKLEPLATAARNEGHRILFFVTGMHMLSDYGLTKEEVHAHKMFEVSEFINQRDGDPQDIILAKTIQGLSDYLYEVDVDMVVFHGDRIEALACGLVCATNQIFSIHIEGGEVSGTIDEQIRHCNTKLARVHLVSSQKAKKRVMQLGEPPNSIFVIGSPELDAHKEENKALLEEVMVRYEIASADYGIAIFHPVTTEQDSIAQQAKTLFDALDKTGKYYVVIMPNNDPGVKAIKKELDRLDKSRFRILPSMRFKYFSCLLQNANILIGNSSTGVREAPFLGVPSVDIGTRQYQRKEAKSVCCASGLDSAEIIGMIDDQWGKIYERDTSYGKGNACELFVRLLNDDSFLSSPLQKAFVDLP